MYHLYKYEEIDGITIKTSIMSVNDTQHESKLSLACLVDSELHYYTTPIIQKPYGFFLYNEDYEITVYYIIKKVF